MPPVSVQVPAPMICLEIANESDAVSIQFSSRIIARAPTVTALTITELEDELEEGEILHENHSLVQDPISVPMLESSADPMLESSTDQTQALVVSQNDHLMVDNLASLMPSTNHLLMRVFPCRTQSIQVLGPDFLLNTQMSQPLT